MRNPVILPELGAADEEIRVSCWLAELGDWIDEGDRLVEILLDGVTFDVTADRSGILAHIECPMDTVVHSGDVLGWIETPPEGTA
jgi:pyruvate/2-oxoglutarate dehydrogenase complex dihydrolipoamide acyltransferase (E2) component